MVRTWYVSDRQTDVRKNRQIHTHKGDYAAACHRLVWAFGICSLSGIWCRRLTNWVLCNDSASLARWREGFADDVSCVYTHTHVFVHVYVYVHMYICIPEIQATNCRWLIFFSNVAFLTAIMVNHWIKFVKWIMMNIPVLIGYWETGLMIIIIR